MSPQGCIAAREEFEPVAPAVHWSPPALHQQDAADCGKVLHEPHSLLGASPATTRRAMPGTPAQVTPDLEAQDEAEADRRLVSQGAKEVFGYAANSWQLEGESPLAQKSRFQPKLWWVLLCFFVSVMLALSLSLSFTWYMMYAEASQRYEQDSQKTLKLLQGKSAEALTQLAMSVQSHLASSAEASILNFMSNPEHLVNSYMNFALDSVGNSSGMNMTAAWEKMYVALKYQFPFVTAVYCAFDDRTFIGFERDQLGSGPYTLSYCPPDGEPSASLMPTSSILQPRTKYFWDVDVNGTFLRELTSNDTGRDVGDFDVTARPWYMEAMQHAPALVWLDPYYSRFKLHSGVTVVRGVKSETGEQLTCGADVNIIYMNEFMSSVNAGTKHARTFLVDFLDGAMVASSDGNQVMNGTVRFNWTQVNDTLITTPLLKLIETFGALDQIDDNGTMKTDEANVAERLLFTYSKVQEKPAGSDPHDYSPKFEYKGTRWLLVTVQLLSEITQQVDEVEHLLEKDAQAERIKRERMVNDKMFQSIGVCTVLTALGTAVMACVSRMVTRPLRGISKHMRSVAKLEFAAEQQHEEELGMSTLDVLERPRRTLCASWEDQLPSIREVEQMRESFSYMSNGLKSFARYMDPYVFQLLVQSRRQARLGVAKADVTIFFSDMVGFTTLAERLAPEDFLVILGRYLEEMSRIIMDGQGVVGEFIGDSIMAWWNNPIDLGERHTAIALEATLAQQTCLAELRKEWVSQGFPEVYARMGVARGTVYAGNIGSNNRMKFGLVGDSVNLASRLEGLCKRYGVDIIIDDHAWGSPGVQEEFICRPLDVVIVKGRNSPTEIFQLVASRKATSDVDLEEYAAFTDGFAHIQMLYRQREFQSALDNLERYLSRFPNDKPATLLQERLKVILEHPLAEDWSYVVKLTEK